VCVVLNNADAVKSLPKHSNGGAQMAQSTVLDTHAGLLSFLRQNQDADRSGQNSRHRLTPFQPMQ
jgi:hypothetical protein